MPTGSQETQDSRERILDAATRLFAEKGYHGTTVALICREAGVNIAAVNYYFQSKEGLYQNAWRRASELLMKRFPPDGGVPPGRPPAERLRGRIRAALQHAMFGDAASFRIMRNEMANPTGILDDVILGLVSPHRQEVQSLIRELLGPAAGQFEVDMCEICYTAPLLFAIHCRKTECREGLAPCLHEEKFESVVDCFTRYALAGIAEIKRGR